MSSAGDYFNTREKADEWISSNAILKKYSIRMGFEDPHGCADIVGSHIIKGDGSLGRPAYGLKCVYCINHVCQVRKVAKRVGGLNPSGGWTLYKDGR